MTTTTLPDAPARKPRTARDITINDAIVMTLMSDGVTADTMLDRLAFTRLAVLCVFPDLCPRDFAVPLDADLVADVLRKALILNAEAVPSWTTA